MNDDITSHSQATYLAALPKLTGYLASIAILCYLAGFAITNLYLGSLGVVNLEILRARYILAGLLFLLFFGALAYLIYGLMRILRRYQDRSAFTILSKVVWYSLERLAVIYFAVPAVAIFAGVLGVRPIGIPSLASATSWSDWFATEPAKVLKGTLFIYAVLWVVLAIVVGVLIVINPKDKRGNRKPRKQVLRDMITWDSKDKKSFLGFFFGAFIFLFALNIAGSLLGFIATNEIGASSMHFPTIPVNGGWGRYFGALAVLYGCAAVYLTFIFIFPSKGSSDPEDASGTKRYSFWIYLITIIIVFVVPVYALGVYPYLPQQIGGGYAVSVEVSTSSDDLTASVSDPNFDVYLMDRASSSSIFLVLDKRNQSNRIVEVDSSLIESITYKPTP